jgi:hypothetical protein
MHIHDFHSKLTSTSEGGTLFEALRSLSQVEDPQAMFNVDAGSTMGNWATWPPMDAHASCAASTGV